MKMDKEIVCVMSHAKSDESIRILKRCLNAIKGFGYEVILASHIDVPADIIELADYFILSRKNPLIKFDEYDKFGGGIYYFEDYPKYYMNKKIDYNHGLAHLRLMLQAAGISSVEGYEKLHLINYDYIIKDYSVLSEASMRLDDNDANFYSMSNPNTVVTGMFSVKSKRFLEVFGHIKSKQEYCARRISILEEFVLELVRSSNMTHHIEDSDKLNGRVEIDLINATGAYGLYECGSSKIRIVPCASDAGQHYLMIKTDRNEEIYLNIEYRGRYYSVLVEWTQFLEIPKSMISEGFRVGLSKCDLSIRIDSKSNISYCVIKESDIVTRLK